MNLKRCKVLRKLADQVVVTWLRNLMPPEEAEKINVKTLDIYLPDDVYFYARGQRRLNIMSPRWVYKQLKKGRSISEIMSATQT